MKWTSDDATAARRISYVNTRGNLDANFAVVVDAFAHIGKVQKIISSATYSSVETELDSRTLQSSDMVGIGGSDFVFPFSSRLTDQEAFSVSYTDTDYEKTARQIYFSDGIELSEISARENISITRLPIDRKSVV